MGSEPLIDVPNATQKEESKYSQDVGNEDALRILVAHPLCGMR